MEKQCILNVFIFMAMIFAAFPLAGEAAPLPPTTLPSSADAARIRPDAATREVDRSKDVEFEVPNDSGIAEIPPVAETIHLNLKNVKIEGSTVYSHEELLELYKDYLGKEVTLKVAWLIANRVTELYRNDGYFLSRAYVPAQNIKDGFIFIKVVEGYIGDVKIDGEADNYVINEYIKNLKAAKPSRAKEVESFILSLNDLPGYSFRAVLAAMDDKAGVDEAAVRMTLIPSDKKGRGLITFDNYGSRFLGPHQILANYSASPIPLHQTTISGLVSTPPQELKYGTLEHQVLFWPYLKLEINASNTKAHPGYDLEQFEIESEAKSVGTSLVYQLIRQRDENLSFKLNLDMVNSASTILTTRLTRDHIRAVRFGGNFDINDSWNGYNTGSFTISKGIAGLGSSHADDINLSRDGAKPNFTKTEFMTSRFQGITPEWSAVLSASGQVASGTLYSSEQFGYGGQTFGRAFDSSEVTGDHGLNGSIEFRYSEFSSLEPIGFSPYSFYDIGKVWNEDGGQNTDNSGSSAGLGVRFTTLLAFSGNVGLAFPLTRDAATPFYGENGKNPRIFFEISKEF